MLSVGAQTLYLALWVLTKAPAGRGEGGTTARR